MTIPEAKELERLKVQQSMNLRLKEFEAKAQEMDGTISRRSGAWHAARTDLAFSRIEASVDDRIAIRRAIVEKCAALATPHETHQFEEAEVTDVDRCFQAVLRSLPISGIRPPASVVGTVATRKSALHHKLRTAARMMQLEVSNVPQTAEVKTTVKQITFHGAVGTYIDGGTQHHVVTTQTVNDCGSIRDTLAEVLSTGMSSSFLSNKC
jgi:hypothetical protein